VTLLSAKPKPIAEPCNLISIRLPCLTTKQAGRPDRGKELLVVAEKQEEETKQEDEAKE
jgi:hypothetical protein